MKWNEVVTERALAICHRMAIEQTGWRRFFKRWYYSDEPLRNDARNLLREVDFVVDLPELPENTKLLGD